MAHEHKAKLGAPIVALLAATVLAGSQPTTASAQDLPPGVSIAAQDAFAPPDGLGAFQALTFVIDLAPGAAFPLHSHPGRSEVMMLQGELTEHNADGVDTVYHPGDAFMEEPNKVHSVTNTGADTVRLVWTLLLPDGTEPIVLHSQ
jgi:quercetin dioxygenase-like cupin family protein